MRRYGKSGGNGAGFNMGESEDLKKGGRNTAFCVIPSVTLFFLLLKKRRLNLLRDNGVISPIRKSSEELWV